MTSWTDFAATEPDLAERVRACFAVRKHATLATLRRDGSPRISGSEVQLSDEGLFIGSMAGAVKALDLLRDPRFALHCPTVDALPGDESSWLGDAKISGLAVPVDPGPTVRTGSPWTCSRWCTPGWARPRTIWSSSPGTRTAAASGSSAVEYGSPLDAKSRSRAAEGHYHGEIDAGVPAPSSAPSAAREIAEAATDVVVIDSFESHPKPIRQPRPTVLRRTP